MANQKASKAKKQKQTAPKPRQKRLPTMDDPKIEALHGLAENYADIRDKRMALGKKEVELKGKLLEVMKAHKKEFYHFDGISIKIKPEKEKVIVRINHGEESEADEDFEDQGDSADDGPKEDE